MPRPATVASYPFFACNKPFEILLNALYNASICGCVKYLESEIGSEYARENEIDEFQKIKNFQFVKKLERS